MKVVTIWLKYPLMIITDCTHLSKHLIFSLLFLPTKQNDKICWLTTKEILIIVMSIIRTWVSLHLSFRSSFLVQSIPVQEGIYLRKALVKQHPDAYNYQRWDKSIDTSATNSYDIKCWNVNLLSKQVIFRNITIFATHW